MANFYLLLVTLGVVPFAVGLARLPPTKGGAVFEPVCVLFCALAFNLTFFWQELWLVIPKAMTPGLHPVLYHNDHSWTGQAPVAELLQGTGALATLTSGLAFAGGMALSRGASIGWRLFLFWMAFQGLFQAFTQLAIGTVLPGNDVGRALAYLHVGADVRWAGLAAATVALAATGAGLARAYPGDGDRTRRFGAAMLVTAVLAVAVVVPFRLPRDPVEVVLVPAFVNIVGAGWLVLGASVAPSPAKGDDVRRAGLLGPALCLTATLLLFQLVLRPGIAF